MSRPTSGRSQRGTERPPPMILTPLPAPTRRASPPTMASIAAAQRIQPAAVPVVALSSRQRTPPAEVAVSTRVIDGITPRELHTQCHNTSTISGTEIWNDGNGNKITVYPENQVLLSYVDTNGYRYCIEPEEIPDLLSYGKNPWNSKPLPGDFLELIRRYRDANPSVPTSVPVVVSDLVLMRNEVDLDLQKGPFGTNQPGDPYITFRDLTSKRSDLERWNRLPVSLSSLNDTSLLENFFNNRQTLIGPMKRNYGLVKLVSSDDPDQVREIQRVFRGLFQTRLDLAGADLVARYLVGADLAGANLTGARLNGAILYGANLTGAILMGANLFYANLARANLTNANLTNANLTEANLTEADLTGAILNGAILNGAILNGAILNGAILNGADLTGAIGLHR